MSVDKDQFLAQIQSGYSFKGIAPKIGVAMLEGQVVPGADIFLPLRSMNRHGLIAGATGTGKTKTLQLISEALSKESVPVLLLDIKGDLSGIAAAGVANERIMERFRMLGMEYQPKACPVELLTLSKQTGIQLRATVTEFGPVLLSKILELNDTQASLVSLIFKYCDDHRLPLLDLKDLIKLLQFISNEGKSEIEAEYGKIATSSTGTILRKVIELQQQGADHFFGEKSFEVEDLMRISNDGSGIVNILRVTELQDRPKLFATFMLQMLAELYAVCPEEGDMDRPKLVLFIDEAHLIFQNAGSALLQQIETIIKLIRSKGVGVFFCTQNPMDIPASVLAQLGLKIQHALRAFTAADRKMIRQTAENYPETTFYQTDELITQLGIGEAFVTLLNEKGIPTPLAHVMLCAPASRMDVLTADELQSLASASKLAAKYAVPIDSRSAYEMLSEKMSEAAQGEVSDGAGKRKAKTAEKEEPSLLDEILDNPVMRQVGRTAASMITRSLLGALGLGGRSRR